MSDIFHLREAGCWSADHRIVSLLDYADLRAMFARCCANSPSSSDRSHADGAMTFVMRIRPYRTFDM